MVGSYQFTSFKNNSCSIEINKALEKPKLKWVEFLNFWKPVNDLVVESLGGIKIVCKMGPI